MRHGELTLLDLRAARVVEEYGLVELIGLRPYVLTTCYRA